NSRAMCPSNRSPSSRNSLRSLARGEPPVAVPALPAALLMMFVLIFLFRFIFVFVAFIVVRTAYAPGVLSNSLRPLQARLLPVAVERFGFGPKKAQEHQEWPARRRQPIGFLVLAWRIMLDVQRQTPVRVAFQIWQHRRVDQVPVEGIRNQQP